MLGNILGALTDAASAEEALAAIDDPGVVERVRRGAAAEGVGVGAFVASTVRQMLDYAEEDVWLDLLGRMSGSPRPGVAALEAMLARAFPEPIADRRHAASIMNTIAPAFGCGGGHFFRSCVGPPQSDAESPLAPEAPIDSTARRHRARHVLPELLLERGSPWHQLEAETIVDHGEPAGRQRDPLPIGAGNVFAVGGGMVRKAGLG